MSHLREAAFLRTIVLPLALVFWLSGCHKWVDLEPPYGPAIKAAEPSEFRLTVDGERKVTGWAFLHRDTVHAGALRIPLQDLEAVEVRKANTEATVGAVLLGAVVAGVLGFILVCSNSDCISSGFGN